jgi:hypothetical protein
MIIEKRHWPLIADYCSCADWAVAFGARMRIVRLPSYHGQSQSERRRIDPTLLAFPMM